MFSPYSYHAAVYGDDWRPDRRNWRDKSDAAIRRENQAKALFDQFLTQCESSSNFPVTKEVVPPDVHLTDACWKSFREYVTSKGCTTKRRAATPQERIESKDHRKGKLYVISVTVPVHPSQAKALMEDKKRKAAAAKEKREEKAKLAAEEAVRVRERKVAEERQLQAKIKEEYAAVVASLDDSERKKEIFADHNAKNEENKEEEVVASPLKKRLKTAPITTLSVPRERMLQHAENVYQDRVVEIFNEMCNEKIQERQKLLSELDERIQAKEETLKQEAREYCDQVKKTIMEMAGAGE
jgi:hypothetical protein